MARDAYSTSEAAKILGLSERRVRQLVADGRLPADRDGEGKISLPQAAVHAERRNRKSGGRSNGRKAPAKAAASAPTLDTDAIAEQVAAVVSKAVEGRLEITQKAESLVRQELDEERARRMEIEKQLEAAKVELRLANEKLEEAGRKRGLFRRREG